MKVFSIIVISISFCFVSYSLKAQDEQEIPSKNYKNRISFNTLGIPSANVITSYERGFKSHAIWLGGNYHINGLFVDEDRDMFSVIGQPYQNSLL